ncbi:ndufa2, NADH:ubiquinone oxidoreductase 10.5kD subunit [Sparganum proliferum]
MASPIKLGPSIKELRFLFSPLSASSKGLKEFILSGYAGLRKANPDVKFMIREGNSVSPSIYARYEFGKEAAVRVDNASKSEIMEKIKKFCH